MYLEVGSCVNEQGEKVPLPWAYVSYYCRTKIYHGCTPEQFQQMEIETVLQDLEFYTLEQSRLSSR